MAAEIGASYLIALSPNGNDDFGFQYRVPTDAEQEVIALRTTRLANAARSSLAALVHLDMVRDWLGPRSQMTRGEHAVSPSDRTIVTEHARAIFIEPVLQEEVDSLSPTDNPGYQANLAVSTELPARIEAHHAVPARRRVIRQRTPSVIESPAQNGQLRITVRLDNGQKLIVITDELHSDGVHETTIRFRELSAETADYYTVGKIIKRNDVIRYE